MISGAIASGEPAQPTDALTAEQTYALALASSPDVAVLEAILPTDAIEGSRYPAGLMKQLDSER